MIHSGDLIREPDRGIIADTWGRGQYLPPLVQRRMLVNEVVDLLDHALECPKIEQQLLL